MVNIVGAGLASVMMLPIARKVAARPLVQFQPLQFQLLVVIIQALRQYYLQEGEEVELQVQPLLKTVGFIR